MHFADDDSADIVEQGEHFCCPSAANKTKTKNQQISTSIIMRQFYCWQTKKKWSLLKWMITAFILMAILMLTGLVLVRFTELKVHVNQISDYVVQKSLFNACSSCADSSITVIGGKEFTKFDKWTDQNGCQRLTITCGLERGTEAIIQWFNGDQNMGASFMERFGQSNVVKSLECNARGQYELFENGHRGEVTKIECIVVRTHQEL